MNNEEKNELVKALWYFLIVVVLYCIGCMVDSMDCYK